MRTESPETTQSTTTTTPAQPALELLALNAYVTESGDYLVVEGMVRNESSEAIDGLVAVAELYYKGDSFIGADQAMIDYQPLLPGQRSPFKVMARHNPAMSGYRVNFRTFGGGQIPYADKRK